MKKSKYIDHTLLKPQATKAQILKLCDEALEYDFASVCVNPYWVKTCAEKLKGSNVMVCTVIGFPLGATTSETKAFETKQAIAQGADEVDMVMNIGALIDGDTDTVIKDIEAVVEAANGKCVKVILETCLLSDEQITLACECCVKAKATFVKTSTGFSTAGANPHVVKVMVDAVKGACKVKAAGGVRTPEEMDEMIRIGADRIGTSSGVKLMNNESGKTSY
ncbi:deoxyribose-phosphate aldolase [uncultured Traorella sp.]|uniref:deoxyribose-phosphate aldolase n=1 Tax=uncultured Traorella sp. TaxID=1929048 RepID=UPI0025E9888F|nr:deoxyribose-phosphate aldolase [uncultured Traorella sp.]